MPTHMFSRHFSQAGTLDHTLIKNSIDDTKCIHMKLVAADGAIGDGQILVVEIVVEAWPI